ncbi:MAG: zf-TFIIB domain-containing protein [Planctomycetota bacterium]|nr:zf-TFIIB domain-containing protein [Planctomycetota bacterium]
MSSLICPHCATPMEHVVDADVATDVCPSCRGCFLDSGELNELATGLAGNIESRSRVWTQVLRTVEGFSPSDEFPERHCPVCAQSMKKIGLVCFPAVVFDSCEQCESFFVDAGEVKAMNRKLTEQAAGGLSQEFRSLERGRLIRGNRFGGAESVEGLGLSVVATTEFQIIVYFNQPLDIGLNIYTESWTAKLAKVFGLYGQQDIQISDREFDSAFIIRGDDPEEVQQLLDDEVRESMLHFISAKPSLFGTPGSVQVFDNCIDYTEGPYSGETKLDWEQDALPVVDQLVAIADLIDPLS